MFTVWAGGFLSREELIMRYHLGKHLSTMQETWVQSLGREDPLEKETAIHSSTIAWKIPWTDKPDKLQSMGSQSQTRLSDLTFTFFHFHHQGSPLINTLIQWIYGRTQESAILISTTSDSSSDGSLAKL